MHSHGKNKISKIQFWVYKASPNSSHLHFLSNGSSVLEKKAVASENLDGTLFKNNYCWQILKFFTGALAYHQPFKC